jgi:hypothetical protein
MIQATATSLPFEASPEQIIRSLMDRLRSTHADLDFTDKDFGAIGLLFLDMFGHKQARARLGGLLQEQLSTKPQDQVARAHNHIQRMTGWLEEEGQPGLAQLALDWRQVSLSNARVQKTHMARLLRLRNSIALVTTWDALQDICEDGSGEQAQRLGDFLDKNGVPARQGHTLHTRLVSFMAKDICQLDSNSHFTDLIYHARPAAMLVEIFGDGAVAFIPDTLDSCFRAIGGTKKAAKLAKLGAAARMLVSLVPGMKEVCEAAHSNIIGPYLEGRLPAETAGTVAASKHDVDMLERLVPGQLVRAIGSPRLEQQGEGSEGEGERGRDGAR